MLRFRYGFHLVLQAALAGVLIAAAPPAAAQDAPAYTPTSRTPAPGLPRTPDGQPDLQDAVWATNFFPVFEASPMAKTLVVTEAESKAMVDTMVAGFSSSLNFRIDPEAHEIIGQTDGLPLVRGERRSRVIVLPADGRMPMTPEARAEAKAADPLDGPLDNPEQRPLSERCMALSPPPIASTISYTRFQFVQTPTHIVMHSENGDEVRIIPFADAHQPPGPVSWSGDSIARWDGDTLIIETIRQPLANRLRGLSTYIVNPGATVFEYITRVSEDELLYQYTIVDPEVYTAPWLAEHSLYKASTGMFPSPCHEHNYSLPNILKGARVADARAKLAAN